VVHADIKPDNILVSANHGTLKLCDFGSAFYETDSDNDPTPYLVSRYYRAPEICMGLAYDRQLDLWSVGTCLFELFVGSVMFPGRTNNEMLRLFMEFKGRFPNKLVKRHLLSYDRLLLQPHFVGDDYRFREVSFDRISGKEVTRVAIISNPTRSLRNAVLAKRAGADDKRLVMQLVDLLEKCTVLDPAQRIDVFGVFEHPFLAAKPKVQQSG